MSGQPGKPGKPGKHRKGSGPAGEAAPEAAAESVVGPATGQPIAPAPVIPEPVAPAPVIPGPVAPLPVVDAGVAVDAAPASAPAVPGPTVMARRRRSAERVARKRSSRRRRLTAVAVVVLLLLVAGAVVWWSGRGTETAVVVKSPPTPQQITLVQVTGVDGTAAASALVGTTPGAKDAVAVLVPSRVVVDVVGSGNMPFGEAALVTDANASAAALTDLLAVRVSDTWVLSQAALAGLVDAVGGVQVTVDADVTASDGKGGEKVVVPAGSQKLAGAGAAAYATYLADGEPEQTRLARFDDVLTAVSTALPVTPAELTAVLAKLGTGSRSTLPAAALAARLLVLHTAAAGNTLVSDTLPVNEVATGAADASYTIDNAAASAMMKERFPGAVLRDAGGQVVRVLVENGVGTPDLGVGARTKLVAKGFRVIDGGNAASFSQEPSVVSVPDGSAASVDRGRRVAAALGLPASSVSVSDRGQTVAEVIVILGSDFRP